MASRLFHVSDVMTVTTGRFLSTRGMDGVYDILNFMTNDNLFTHQLPRANDECAPYLSREYPILNNLDVEKLDSMLLDTKASRNKHEIMGIVANWVKLECDRLSIPEFIDVEQIPSNRHEVINPIDELRRMGAKKG